MVRTTKRRAEVSHSPVRLPDGRVQLFSAAFFCGVQSAITAGVLMWMGKSKQQREHRARERSNDRKRTAHYTQTPTRQEPPPSRYTSGERPIYLSLPGNARLHHNGRVSKTTTTTTTGLPTTTDDRHKKKAPNPQNPRRHLIYLSLRRFQSRRLRRRCYHPLPILHDGRHDRHIVAGR